MPETTPGALAHRASARKGTAVEVKIGVREVNRELVLESSQSADDVVAAVDKALAGEPTLQLRDEKGRLVLVPTGALAYVEIGAEESRRVGFGAVTG